MGYQSSILRAAEVTPGLADAWDAMAAGRGLRADVYDSHAWLSSWWDTTGAEVADRLRIPAVLDGDRPVGLLPLVTLSPGRWEFAGRGGGRMRYRPVLAGEEPDAEVLGLLADQVGRAGVRDLTLPRMPGRDPATALLAGALRQAGFRVASRERSSDCLAVVAGGWDEHRRRFAGYEKSVRRFANRLRPLWDVTLDEHGPDDPVALEEGYGLFAGVHTHSWKKPLTPPMRAQALELLRRAGPRGWPRVYVLRVAGVPAAVHVWFRLGPVATWLETAYDQRLSALGPGTILMWWSQERIFRESVPGVVDFIPGHNPQKDRLGPDRTPILALEAARRTLVSGVTFPVRRQARFVAPAVALRVRRRLAGLRRRGPGNPKGVPRGIGAAAPAPPPGPGRAVEVAPGDGGQPVAELALDPSVRRFLAAVCGQHGPDAMAAGWAEGDGWWRIGDGPLALARVGTADGAVRPVREVVLFEAADGQLHDVLAALAGGLAAPVAAPPGAGDGDPGPAVRRALLPWPRRDADPWRVWPAEPATAAGAGGAG
jgi:CelD/BcsL family acetyltransferase involved in cellulose biosynthesis